MEEVKFRAWDKIEKRMCMVTKIDWIEGKVVLSHGEPFKAFIDNHEEYERDIDDVKLMKYIGETDKNNKDIYESDIIKYSYSALHRYGCNIITEVRYLEKNTGFYPFVIQTYGKINIEKIKVIGNKYQNGELLKEE